MGIQDFLGMFDMIDVSHKGYITASQLHQFCEKVYFTSLSTPLVNGAIHYVCGSHSSLIQKQKFIEVLQDLERRRSIDEQAYWDFQALDLSGSNRISLKDSLLLFKEYHGDGFSASTWHKFLSSREEKDEDVYFDEIRYWLSAVASGTPFTDKELKEEENRLELRQTQYKHDSSAYKFMQDDSLFRQKEEDENRNDMIRDSSRMLDKWNKKGVESILVDDGLEADDGNPKSRPKGRITPSDMSSMLEVKYEQLKEKLLMEMAKFSAAVESEEAELLEQLRRQEKHYRRRGQTDEGGEEDLPGGSLILYSGLMGLMGELKKENSTRKKEMEDLKAKLKQEGKTVVEIFHAVQEHYQSAISVNRCCSAVLKDLHTRHETEREEAMKLFYSDDGQPLEAALAIEYGRLVREVAIIEEQQAERDNFVLTATAVGLAERALDQVRDRTDWDRMRSEQLAQLHLLNKHNKKPVKSTISPYDVSAVSERGTFDLQIDIIKEVTQKHFFEREALIDMLQGADSKKKQEKIKKTKLEDIKRQLKALTNQHKTLMKTSSQVAKDALHKLLFEAVCLYRETRRSEIEISFPNISENEINMVVLADLLQRQGVDFEKILQQMQTQNMDDLVTLLLHETEASGQEHYQGIAYITLSCLEITEDDLEFIKALDGKYETLRRSMFLMAIKDKFGSEYKNLSKSEKRDEISRKKKEEMSLRSQGKFEEMTTLLGMKAKMLASIRELMGEEKAEFEQRMIHIKQTVQSPGPDEEKVNRNKEINHLADLVHRYDSEQENLLSYLHSPEVQGQNLRTRRLKIVELMLETKRIKFEEDFEVAALSAGLMERIKAAVDGRHKSDRDRQNQLARKRVLLRQKRLLENEKYSRNFDLKKKPENGDITGWQTAYLVEMMKRHMDERELMLSVLQDESIEELVEAAATMPLEEKQKRLAELQGKWQILKLDDPDYKEEQTSILEEAAAIFASSRRIVGHTSIDMGEVTVETLTELQDEQDRELALAFQDVDTMDEDALGQRLTNEIHACIQGAAKNVIIILTRYQGIAQDSDLLQALDQKYEMLQEKLFADGLLGRIGTDPWQKLEYSEKQQRLQALKVHARKGDKASRQIPAIAGDGFVLLEPILEFIGMPVSEFSMKITNMQQEHSGMVYLKIPEESSLYTNRQNPFVDIKCRLEEDKADLLRRLRGQSGKGYGEYDRLLHLVRLRREKKLAEQEQTFDTAARLTGLCERQQIEIRVRLLRDKERYKCLAREKLKLKDGDLTTEGQIEISRSKDKLGLLDHLMDLLERKHRHERQIFNQMLSQTDKYSDIQQMAALSTQQQRQDRLSKLRSERLSQIQGIQKEVQEILQEAVIIKIEDRRHRLSLEENSEEMDDQQVNLSLMGDLLEQQNSEAERLLQSAANKTEADILDKQRQVISDREKDMCENIAQVIFTAENEDKDSDIDLIEALKGKYDALRDQLLAEALLKELGESVWNRMTEKEKQKRLLQLKLKERQLRKAGRLDEAEALLGDFLKTQDTLRQLMGDTKVEQKRRAEERLKKRRLRLQQGMTEEECDKLEAKERAEEEEEDKQEKRNILLDLQHRYEKEKEELLQRIREGADEFERERERQSLLTKLRRDQRLAREEDKFESAALILGLADKHDNNHLEERHRQEQLARDRLEAARQRRQQGQPSKEHEGEEEVIMEVDHENITALQEAAVRDLDHKHRKERDLFIQLLNEQTNGEHRDAARNMNDEERDDKLQELLEMYNLWQKSDDKNPLQEKELLEEAVGTRVEDLQQKFQKDGEVKSDDDLQVTLLADLQQKQDRESEKLLSNLQDMDLKSLQHLHRAQTTLKQTDNHTNVATVLLDHDEKDTITHTEQGQTEKEVSERQLMKTLESKYDAVRDKLFLEALIKEYGELEWNKLTETERQRKLVRMKLKERKLRKEGKLDEAAGILSDFLQNEKVLEEIFGESKLDQKQRLQERLRRRKELIKQRQAEGLAIDDSTIDAIIQEEQEKEEEEKKMRRRNILLELQNCYDDEKAAILGALKRQKDKMAEDRERQLAMAKLRRDKRRLQKEQKFQSVAMLISSAKEYEQRREEGLSAERERQLAVARERLSAKRKKRQGKINAEKDLEEKKQNQLEEVLKDATEERTVAEAVLETLDARQYEEINIMANLIEYAREDKTFTNQAKSMSDEDLKSELMRMEKEQKKWRKLSEKRATCLQEDSMNPKKWEKHLSEVEVDKSKQLRILTQALADRIEVEKRQMSKVLGLGQDEMMSKIEVSIMADLQEKQQCETNAVQKILEEHDDMTVKKIRDIQRVALQEGWFDNVSATVFQMSDSQLEADPQLHKIDMSIQEQLNEMDRMYQVEKEQALDQARKNAKPGETIDEEAILKKLSDECENKKETIKKEMMWQRELTMERLAARKSQKEAKEYEDLTAQALIKMAQNENSQKQVHQEHEKQGNLLQTKLAARRKKREEAKKHEATMDIDEELSRDGSTPIGKLQREKTNISLSEDEKQAQYKQLLRSHLAHKEKLEEQKKRQEDMLQRRLANKKGKIRQDDTKLFGLEDDTAAAAELLSLGERQKTVLEKFKENAKDRQLSKMKEKLAGKKRKYGSTDGASSGQMDDDSEPD